VCLPGLARAGPIRGQIRYRLAWARTYLNGLGLLTNSRGGVWTVTAVGQAPTSRDQVGKLLTA
jgi:restriction system protein